MQKNILKIEGLSHRYTQHWAIRDINFEIDQTGIVGLLGSNGAGKSTTMNIICGVLNQTEGSVLIDGTDIRKEPEKAKRLIGFLPQHAPLHLDLTVDEYLRHCAVLRGIESGAVTRAMSEAKEWCGISHFSKRLIKNLSGGYRQRVGIAQAIIHKPKLVILDEPTNGLDPNQVNEVRGLIKEIGRERSVIFSSHILSEVQATCREIKMIESGKMVFSDSMDAFNNYIRPNSLEITANAPPSREELGLIEGVTQVDQINENRIRLHFNDAAAIASRIIKKSIEEGWDLQEISFEKSSLEEIFAQLSKNIPETKPITQS